VAWTPVRPVWREQNARMQISSCAISLNKVSRTREREREREREGQSEREKSNSKNGRRARTSGTSGTQPSLIIELNVANADFDESSGFECPLRYVTVTLASQLTN